MVHSSLRARYTAKLSTNLIGLAVNMVTQAIIPRALGPKAYGDFNFLSNFFLQLMPFFSLNTSTGFYTKLCQRQHETSLIIFYLQFSSLFFLSLFMFVGTSQLTGISNILWLDLDIRYVYMAAFWGILTWLMDIATKSADAYGLTVSTEIVRIAQRIISLLIIVILFSLDQLNLTTFFLYHYGILLLLILLFFGIISRNRFPIFHNWYLSKQQIKGYFIEFYEYSHPLFIYGLVGMLADIMDRWLLQKFSGSVQQGFFGISYQVGAVCFVFTSAMTSLIMREFAIAYKKNDLKEMARLFRRYTPLLYSIAAFFGCFACVQAEKITYIFGGGQFVGASMPVAIMALYPIHQTLGQLSGSVFFAAGQTVLYRNLGLLLTPIGLSLTYFMLAPAHQMGLNAGAAGLALKFVLFQFFAVNIHLFYNARLLQLKFINYVAHQIFCLTCLLSAAYFSKHLIDIVTTLHNEILISFFLSGVLYCIIAIALGYLQPVVYGLKRDDVAVLTNIVFSRIKFG